MTRTCRSCGCTPARACPGGCYWLEEDLCSSCANVHVATDDLELLVEPVAMELAVSEWLVLHGTLCLALQAPELQRRLPRALLERIVGQLGEALVELEVITPELREEARRELVERPRIVLVGG
jgi:hypothetical protein